MVYNFLPPLLPLLLRMVVVVVGGNDEKEEEKNEKEEKDDEDECHLLHQLVRLETVPSTSRNLPAELKNLAVPSLPLFRAVPSPLW